MGAYGTQSAGEPCKPIAAGPEGWTSPAQMVNRPHERSTRPNGPDAAVTPPASVVISTCPGSTCMLVSRRPDGDRASTSQGSGGSVATSIRGWGPPGFDSATFSPLTVRVTASVVPFEMRSCGRSGRTVVVMLHPPATSPRSMTAATIVPPLPLDTLDLFGLYALDRPLAGRAVPARLDGRAAHGVTQRLGVARNARRPVGKEAR